MKKDFRTLDRKTLDTVAGGVGSWSWDKGASTPSTQNWASWNSGWNNQWKA